MIMNRVCVCIVFVRAHSDDNNNIIQLNSNRTNDGMIHRKIAKNGHAIVHHVVWIVSALNEYEHITYSIPCDDNSANQWRVQRSTVWFEFILRIDWQTMTMMRDAHETWITISVFSNEFESDSLSYAYYACGMAMHLVQHFSTNVLIVSRSKGRDNFMKNHVSTKRDIHIPMVDRAMHVMPSL